MRNATTNGRDQTEALSPLGILSTRVRISGCTDRSASVHQLAPSAIVPAAASGRPAEALESKTVNSSGPNVMLRHTPPVVQVPLAPGHVRPRHSAARNNLSSIALPATKLATASLRRARRSRVGQGLGG